MTTDDPTSRAPGAAAPPSGWDRARLAALIDHTLLRPEAGAEQVHEHVAEGDRLGVHAVCVSPARLPVHPQSAVVCTVIGFPSGQHHPLIKAMEARLAVEQGATELDVVVDYAPLLSGSADALLGELVPVRDAAPGVQLKAILETAAIYAALGPEAGDAAVAAACEAAVRAGCEYVKTSTGYHPAGGADVRAVRVMRQAVPEHIGVKAAGGIRTAAQAIELIAAGATRIGCSATAELLAELPL